MMTERGLVAPTGGGILACWDDILAAAAPELAGHVRGVAFDADTGRLDVTPDAPACGMKLRWSAPKLIAAANERVPDANIAASACVRCHGQQSADQAQTRVVM
ncbi:hypothetical protein [Streptomyces sp. NPDC056061]|uniref:hypothetical protein n=1 Tax=Streptomyces sp. NPDC056061 TaxID=3345700 RepID=UPI0035DDA044